MRRPLIAGFTLLEVMIAVAILGLALTAIFSSESGAVRTGVRARNLTVATLLARCKMAEVEEHLLRDGFPVAFESGDDACCEDGEHDGFTCHWRVERVVLPDSSQEVEDPMAALGGIAGDHEGDTTSGVDLEGALSGAAGGDAIGEFAVQYAFPIIKPMIEDQVRRATVYVRWHEGIGEAPNRNGPCEEGERHCFPVVQYVVADQGTDPSALDPNAPVDPNNPNPLNPNPSPTPSP